VWSLYQLAWETIRAVILLPVQLCHWTQPAIDFLDFCTDAPRKRPKQAARALKLLAELNV